MDSKKIKHIGQSLTPYVRNLPELFKLRCEVSGSNLAYKYKEGGRWIEVSWSKFKSYVDSLAGSLVKDGIKQQDKVSILGDTRPEWAICDLGALSVGAVPVGIYQTLSAKQVNYIVSHSDSKIVFVQNREQLEKIKAMRNKLRRIVVWQEEDVPPDDTKIVSLHDYIKWGEDYKNLNRVAGIEPDDVAIIVYTSGTTGPPKGAMITHRNILSFLSCWDDVIKIKEWDISFHFLPMSHVAERIAGFYGRINMGIPCAYATSIKHVLEEIGEVRPTIFGSVPRIFEKAYSKIQTEVEKLPPRRKAIFRWAESVGRDMVRLWQEKKPIPRSLKLKHKLADALVFRRLKNVFGGRVRYFISGAAPISYEILEFFWGCGFPIVEVYGLTEATVITHSNIIEDPNEPFMERKDIKLGTVGRPIPVVDCKLAEDGEILIRGPTVFKGYYKNEEATREVIDEDGWLHTGDIGEIDYEGFLKITDRKKHIIVTSGGKNITPANIENLVKAYEPMISQVHVHGDRRPYLVAIITISEEGVEEFAKEKGIEGTYRDLVRHPGVVKKVIKAVEKANSEVSSVEKIRKFKILSRDLTIDDGEVTPTLKVRRKIIEQKFKELFDRIYDGKEEEVVEVEKEVG